MKKLLTLFAFLAVVLGAKADLVDINSIDFSTFTGYPHYVMGYVPEWVDGVMTDYGANYRYATDEELEKEALKEGESIVGTTTKNDGTVYNKILLPSAGWHQYFIITGTKTELDGNYKLVAMIRASEACNLEITFQKSDWSGGQINTTAAVGTDWAEVEWDFNGVQGTSMDAIAKPAGNTATIEWKWIKIKQDQREQRPVVWRNVLTEDGEATGTYKDGVFATLYKSYENEYNSLPGEEIMKLVKNDVKPNADGVFQYESVAVDKTQYTTNAKGDDISNNYGWANQMFIVSPEKIKSGDIIKVEFDYKASEAAKTNTQAHAQPSNYNHWQFMGDVNFTTEWQHANQTITIDDSMSPADKGMYSIAFNLNPENCNAVLYELKNLNISKMVLDEGWFIASSNKEKGIEYDFDNAVVFVENSEDDFEATVGTKGDKGSWVNEVMISTVRGNDGAFKNNAIGLKTPVKGSDPDEWYDYAASVNAKIKLPAAGVWNIHLDPVTYTVAFEMLEGEEIVEPIEIVPNPTEVVVHGVERDWLGLDDKGNPQEEQVGEGQPWDNQFLLMANRALTSGEVTVIEFDYVATVDAKVNTQCGEFGNPGGYVFWNALGDVEFTTTEQHYTKTYTVPGGADGMGSFNFNMAVIKPACDYTIKNIVWKLQDGTESLIDMEGTKNFFVKEGAGTAPYQFGTDPDGISNVSVENSKNNVVYNLAGQRVSKSFKGIAIQNGHKVVLK